ncbi:right-handed parallel beta-helix repeat-containing protein [bacterium]|nr:right-handed parallel beta-helix repeat-containing protein [bacterium]
MKKCLLPLAAVACWAACQPASFAQPIPLPPIIASDTILDPSEYIVVDQTLVDPGARLTVPPGAIIRFQNPDSSLNVFGSLLAIGTPDSRVVFTSAKSGAAAQPGDWGEVYINANPSAPPTILQQCEFSFGGGQVALDNAAARVMLRVESYPVLIEDCTFSRAFGSGAGYFGPPSQTFTRCAFLDNVYGGVAALNPSRANINLVDCIVGGNYIALMGVWRPEDFAGSSGNVFANTYNAVVLAAGGTVPTGETVTISSPPVETGLLGIIEGSYTVEQDGTLQVAPEARIYFTAGARILVSGAFATSGAGLVAHKGGARGQEVNDETAFAYFSAIPSFKLPRTREELAARPSGGQPAPPGAGGPIDPAQVWRGITFLRDADDARSVVQHLWLDRADVALTFDRASVRVDGCTVSNVVNAGVRVGTAAHPEISRSLITNSLGDGIVCERDAAPALSRTTITGSRRAGLVIRDEANPMLLENIIVGNRDGVEISGTAAPVLGNIDNHLPWDDGRNIIVDNTRWALANYTPNRIMEQNIFWGLHQASEIDKVIFDDDENPAMGQVVFLPLLGQNPTPTVPVSPTPTPTPAPYQLTPSPTPTTPVETFLSGTLNSDLTLSGVVRVTGSVTVQGFAALRFLPGTIVRIEGTFDALSAPETAVYIRARNGGRIGVEGTRDQPVVFTTVNDTYWGGLSIEGPEWVTSSVRYAQCSGR